MRILVPDDLQAVYGTTRKNLALGTSDRKVAVVRAALLKRAEWLSDFEQKRGTSVEAISPESVNSLVETVEHQRPQQRRAQGRRIPPPTRSQRSALLNPQGTPEKRPADDLSGLEEVPSAKTMAC